MKLLPETLLVAGVGIALGFAANALSPRGLELKRNYFPSGATPVPISPQVISPAHPATNAPAGEGSPVAESPVFARLRGKGLQPGTLAEIQQLHADPRFALGAIVFLDDRDHEYAEGHVPGAYQFFHYRAQEFLPTVLPVLQAAEKIVVYCGGGTCEDSEFAALMLTEIGVPREKLIIYVGGMKEWKANQLPLELGERNSGRLAPAAK